MLDPKQIIELAKEIEEGDPIDWSDLPFSRDTIYNMLGLGVLEQAYRTSDQSEREIILMAGLIKLTVENFVLELRLINK